MTRQTGRPADETGRLAKEIRTYDFLDANHVWYERIDHEAAMTMEVCEEIDKALEATICKNLFLCNRQETNFYLLMLPGHKKFKTKDISKQLGVARGETFLREGCLYGRIPGYHAGLRECAWADK